MHPHRDGGCPVSAADLFGILRELFEAAYVTDRGKGIVFWNAAAEALTGYAPGEVEGTRCCDGVLTHVDAGGRSLCDDACPLSEALSSGAAVEMSVFLEHRLGHRIPVRVRAFPVGLPDGGEGVVELFTAADEIADLRARTAELERLALLDPLTGAGNRRFARMLLDSRLSDLRRYGLGFALALLDLDGLKDLNDTRGHAAGDAALRMVAATVGNTLRSSDRLCRWGGDEFAAFMRLEPGDSVERMAARLVAMVAASEVRLDGSAFSVSISAGMAPAMPGETAARLLARVDGLLYEAKDSGGSRAVTPRIDGG